MAERHESERQAAVGVYERHHGDTVTRREVYPASPTTAERATPRVTTPVVDRVRWGPVIAGLFAALTSLIFLSVLGLAIGFTTYDLTAPFDTFGLGAGIWGAISTVIAFLIGGWLAARTAPPMGRSLAVLNGTMVWIVAIPLILYFFGAGIGGVLLATADVAATGVPRLVPGLAEAAEQAAAQLEAQAALMAETAATAAWGTLLALILGLAAAAFGGLLGARWPTARTETVGA